MAAAGFKENLAPHNSGKKQDDLLIIDSWTGKIFTFFKFFSEKCWKLAKNLKNIFSKIEKLFLKIIISFKVDQQPQQLLQMKTRMTSFTLEPTLLRKKSNLDGVLPHLATPMGGVNPLPKLEIGNNPHLM